MLRIVTAFESRRIQTLRADDVAEACERIPIDMPHVVLAFVSTTDAEREALADRALAVGALVVHVAPGLDEDEMKPVLDDAVRAALELRARQEAAELAAAEVPSSEELDEGLLEEGWGD